MSAFTALKNILLVLLKSILFVLLSLMLIFAYFYLTAPVYRFNEPKPFSGNYLINPYEQADSGYWRKYNFQVQSKAWYGLTDGRRNSNMLIDSMYHLLSYDYVATSDYQKINQHRSDESIFIPTYEHGYNFRKTHQVCIGANSVLWRDYFFSQNLGHKQHVIDELRDDCSIIALAHPLLLGGYTVNDMKYLSNYDLIEVLNNLRVSTAHWDTALSNGHRVYILANDDAHDVSNSNEVGRRFTMINSASLDKEEIITALKSGNAYGFDFYRVDDEEWSAKIKRSASVPHLIKASLDGNSYTVELSKPFHKLFFIGQHGNVLDEAEHWHTASYEVRETDPYVRVEVLFYDSSVMFLNPITRSTTGHPEQQSLAWIDTQKTLIFRVVSLSIVVFLLGLAWRFVAFKRKTTG
ncbi:MAG: hypothetical protein Q8S18_09310 [Bacteroidales bacterium]|nr:hypothetical protein [Bacteroidales bacterium]